MHDWRERLRQKGRLAADGAWGTELAARGLPAGAPPELWNVERPDEVRRVAASYVAAGVDVILTNTFGGNRVKLEKAGVEHDAAMLNRGGARISRQAAGETTLVFASVGPTGEFMEPLGPVSESDMIACFGEQIRALADGGADGIVIESMVDLTEAKAALRAVRECSTLPAVVSLTFDKGAKGYATMMGVRPAQAAEELDKAGADVVGANCGAGIEDMIEVIRLMRAATDLPLWAKPNAGLPELVDGRTVFRETPEEMARRLPGLVKAGADIIGGCCGTTPEHIKLLVQELAGAGSAR